MLPLLAVLLVAQSAVAAPSIAVSAYPVNQYPIIPDNGRLVSSFIIDGSSAFVDAADTPLYVQMLLNTAIDMANSGDTSTQANAVITTIATLGELVSGIPGDSCESAALINAYAYAASTGNYGGLKQAVNSYISRLSTYIDLISNLIVNPSSVKFSSGPRGTCLGGGRTYQFEEAWDGILSNANAYQIGLLNELYCSSRRLYNAYSVNSNNVAAAATATAIPQINQLTQVALPSLASFLRVVAQGGNPTQAAATAKAGLAQAAAQVKY